VNDFASRFCQCIVQRALPRTVCPLCALLVVAWLCVGASRVLAGRRKARPGEARRGEARERQPAQHTMPVRTQRTEGKEAAQGCV
jgi:hypothetical protein